MFKTLIWAIPLLIVDKLPATKTGVVLLFNGSNNISSAINFLGTLTGTIASQYLGITVFLWKTAQLSSEQIFATAMKLIRPIYQVYCPDS